MPRKSGEEDEDIAVEEWDEDAEGEDAHDAESDEDDQSSIHVIGRMFSTGQDRGGHTPGDIAARLSSLGTLTEQDIHWSAGANDPTWVAPRQPVQQIIKVLAKLEHVGGYRRPRDVFSDWLNLVEATLHMLPQQLLYLRLH